LGYSSLSISLTGLPQGRKPALSMQLIYTGPFLKTIAGCNKTRKE
jgi:hypothetical protein